MTIRNVLTCVFLLATASASFARGGVIGGGEVSFVTVFECSAHSIDPTHPLPFSKMEILAETSYDGEILRNLSMTLAFKGKSGKYLSFHPIDRLPGDKLHGAQITRYREGSEGNWTVGFLELKGEAGHLRSYDANELTEAMLSECAYRAEPL